MTEQSNDIVTVQIFRAVHEAEIARGFLAAQGIESFVPDQHAHVITRNGAAFEVRLQVKTEDLERARALLENPPSASDE